MEGGVGSFPRACVCVQKMWLSTITHTTLGKHKNSFQLATYTVSGHKHSLISENKTILGHLTENSTFSLLSSPP